MIPVIKESDCFNIKAIVNNLSPAEKTKEISILMKEIYRATVLPDEQVADDIIQLNSTFEVKDVSTNQVLNFTLTVPKLANLAEKKLSIFTPLGAALIGFRQGMVIDWELPGGKKKLEILKVSSQSQLVP
jgi:regulator of nucleoside diphosphate kinase